MVKFVYTVTLVIALMGVVGMRVAYGTNESSYKFGYHTAIDNLTNLITVPPPGSSWSNNPNICDTQDGCPHNDDAETYCLGDSAVTNVTACIDDYVNGFNHWCTKRAMQTIVLTLFLEMLFQVH
jgi:hypothetical protein